MCGIVGGFAFNEKGFRYFDGISPAVKSLRQRGPDQSGVCQNENVVLGQTRLSVIDVTEAASQPFTDAGGRYTIVYNGEIYNFRELRKSLSDKGISFRSNSDTEVLLYGYIVEGPSFLEKINGFFAFCIYDRSEGSLFLARDRMGIKPLMVYRDNDVFLFASELKALICLGIPKVLDTESLYCYLQLNYVPAPASIFRDVIKVGPGTCLKVIGKNVETKSFYRIPYEPEKIRERHDSYEQACKHIAALMELSVQRRLISDVPLGAFLSGGVDSSIIVGLASRHVKQLNTFSIGFRDEPLFDETEYAEEVAKKYKTNHSVFRLSTDDLFDVLPQVLEYTDEPFADSSALAVYILSRETRKHVTVALSGDGADELYGGYIKHSAECRMRSPGFAERLVQWGNPLWEAMPKSRNSVTGNRIRQLERFAAGMNLSDSERYWRWACIADEGEARDLLGNGIFSAHEYNRRKDSLVGSIRKGGDLNDVLYTDMNLVLRNDMLVKVDRMSMANSLEVRVPFLDHDHVNYVFSLPWYFKADKHLRKKVLQDAFRELLPSSVFHRRKHGFEVPLLKWFRTELNPMIHNNMLEPGFLLEQGIFNPEAVTQLITRLESADPGDTANRVWGLIVFQHWWKRYMNNSTD